MNTSSKKTVSTLLDPEATGGETAQNGIRFQTNVALMYLPRWLGQDGFTTLIIESMGDTEARIFVPGRGMIIDFIEAKNHQVHPKEFWDEIKRFMTLDRDHPGTYAHFTLACDSLSSELGPLLNALRRVRQPRSFYGPTSSITKASFRNYVRVIEKRGKSEEEARFLFERVSIETHLGNANRDGATVFMRSLMEMLPAYGAAASNDLMGAYNMLSSLIHDHLNQPLSRGILEAALDGAIKVPPPSARRLIRTHTVAEESDALHLTALQYNWPRFFGGNSRNYPPSADWNILLAELQATKTWIVENQQPRRIRLTGNRRLSASLALGSVFSAVAGFALEVELRGGVVWATDHHATAETPNHVMTSRCESGTGSSLVVILGIGRSISEEVMSCLSEHGLTSMPILSLESRDPIVSADQAHLVVKQIKEQVAKTLLETHCSQVHLFLAGPAFLALLLGHRLNATGPVQCYEWVSAGKYVPSCQIG